MATTAPKPLAACFSSWIGNNSSNHLLMLLRTPCTVMNASAYSCTTALDLSAELIANRLGLSVSNK